MESMFSHLRGLPAQDDHNSLVVCYIPEHPLPLLFLLLFLLLLLHFSVHVIETG